MRFVQRLRRTGRSVVRLATHPLLFAFLPAIVLGGVWFGPEGMLAVAAIAVPVVAIATQGTRGRGAGTLDPLTGLPLEADLLRDIADDLGRPDRSDHPSALFSIDIINLTDILTQHGQAACDAALVAVAQRLRATTREADRCARLSDGRFAVLARRPYNMTAESAVALGHRLRNAVEATAIPWAGGQIVVTVAVGGVLDNQMQTPQAPELLKAALVARAEATGDGAQPVQLFSLQMRDRVDHRIDLAAELRRAFEDGQIEPWYQPQVSPGSGQILGFEALARWQHPDRGVIPPAAFLDALETAGLMARLGETMLFHALAALRAWDRAGLRVDTVGVNFSAAELRDPRLVDRVRWELDRFDILPERLCVEVLENVVAEGADDIICRNVEALSKLGCRIDLDDFGTGHASITNIRRFAVARLKIDRSFITGLESDPDQRKLTAAILTMAEQLELDTLAEGVETPAARETLATMGCGGVQGFGIARPMPFEDTIAWIKRHQRTKLPTPEPSLRRCEPLG